ncbi:carboxypeptidase-like regulatory domain-containing protein [Spirosoma pomorum]
MHTRYADHPRPGDQSAHFSTIRSLLAITVILLNLFLGAASWAQSTTGTIRGQIQAETGEPLPAITIRLDGTGFGAVTDEAGQFTIKRVPVVRTH